MNRPNNLSFITISILTVFALLFSGCGSTDSNNNDDGNGGNNPPQVNFNSPNISPGNTFSYTFESEGEVEYYCTIHAPDMQGKITVSSTAEAVARDTVFMEGMTFNPSELTIAPNTEVVWINQASVEHTVYSGNPSSGDGGSGGDGPTY